MALVLVNILVTGGTGFIGKAIINSLLLDRQFILTITIRRPDKVVEFESGNLEKLNVVSIGEVNSGTDWSDALNECGVVIHCAAQVHIMDDLVADPLMVFREVNTLGTLNLAKQAAQIGVRRFIFISTVKVNGEWNPSGHPFGPDDVNIPSDPYGLSKYEAEAGLRELANKSGMEVVIIRPPLVYGPGVKGNFDRMVRWLIKGAPLPFGAVDNQRSLVSVANLVSLITVCIEHPKAANETFLVSDGCDLSTTDLLTKLSLLLNTPRRLLPVPAAWLMLAARLLGKEDVAQRLLGSLQVDIEKNRFLLDWTPPMTVDEGLKAVADSFITENVKE